MVAVTCCMPSSSPLMTLSMSTMIVSANSTIRSSLLESVMLPLELPADMMMAVADAV